MRLVDNRIIKSTTTTTITKRRGKLLKAERTDKAINSAKASAAVEGLYVTNQEENLIRERLTGKITESEFKRRALELINE